MADKDALGILPDEMIPAAAIPVDQDLTIVDAEFVIHNYAGKGPETCAAKITLENDEGKQYEQMYSVGPPDKYVPSKDGKHVLPVGTAVGITDSCNLHLFMTEVLNVGYPADKVAGGDISGLIGLKAHFIGKPQPERTGLVRKEGQRPPAAIPVPGELIGGGKAKGKAKASGGGDAVAELMTMLGEVLDSGASITLKKLGGAVYANRGDHPLKEAMVNALFSDEFKAAVMGSDDFSLDGDKVERE